MKTLICSVIPMCRLFTLLAVGLCALPCMAAPRGWTTDYGAAVTKAKADNKILLLNFMGNRKTNADMDKIHNELLLQDPFYEYAEKHGIILVDIVVDSTKPDLKKTAKAACKQFHVDGYPWILFVGPDGKELGRVGYIPGGTAAYFAKFDAWRLALGGRK